MGCKCENPTIEKKDEIESQIKKNILKMEQIIPKIKMYQTLIKNSNHQIIKKQNMKIMIIILIITFI